MGALGFLRYMFQYHPPDRADTKRPQGLWLLFATMGSFWRIRESPPDDGVTVICEYPGPACTSCLLFSQVRMLCKSSAHVCIHCSPGDMQQYANDRDGDGASQSSLGSRPSRQVLHPVSTTDDRKIALTHAPAIITGVLPSSRQSKSSMKIEVDTPQMAVGG